MFNNIIIKGTKSIVFPIFFKFSKINPACAGSSKYPRIFLQYRNQWPTLENAFVTYEGSYDQYFKSINGGIGLNILQDNVAGGILTATNLDMIYSYRSKISSNFMLQSALQASFLFHSLNASSLNASPAINSSQTTQPDFSIGFLGMTKYSNIGLSLHHLNSGYLKFNSSFVNTPLKITFFYSRDIKIYDKDKVKDNGFILTPAIMLEKQAQSIFIDYGADFTFGNFIPGIWMRDNLPFQLTSIIFSIGYTFNNIRVGYSYNYEIPSINNLMPMTGANEFTLVMFIQSDPKNERYRPVKCSKGFN